jgi:hypothetical protein
LRKKIINLEKINFITNKSKSKNQVGKSNSQMLRLYDTMLNFVENLLENERGPMNDQDLTKTTMILIVHWS